MKKLLSLILAVVLCASAIVIPASAKTIAAGQTVDTVLLYAENKSGERVLVSHVRVADMEADLQAGMISDTNHNYSVLDRYVTTVHQEAQGFTVPEFVSYMQEKSTVAAIKNTPLTFAGDDVMAFWEIDQTGYDDMDTYTYDDLYGVPRYNFPLLYE